VVNELYDSLETDSSKIALIKLAKELPKPFVILGGWAVYLTVNKSFEEEHGHSYLGSKDVDVGFHIDLNMNVKELKNSNFGRAIEILNSIGYIPSGTSRFSRIIHRETGELITEEQAKTFPIYDLFYQYVDLILDQIHPGHNEFFSIKPIDEPILINAFNENRFKEIIFEGEIIHLPNPEILLATKLKAFPGRDKEDKKIKDACDIYALIWNSPVNFKNLINLIKKSFPELCSNIMGIFKDDISFKASNHLGIDKEVYEDVIKYLIE
jgi:hypothetical protein